MIGGCQRFAGLALIGLVLLAGILPASGHATLVSAEPQDGAMLASAPAEFVLTFNEPVAPLAFKVIAPDGDETTPAVDASDRTVRLRPQQPLPDGTSILSWRVVSADGHPVGGALAVSVRVRSETASSAVGSADDLPLRAAIWFCRVLLYCGLFFGVGGAFFITWTLPDKRRFERAITMSLGVGAMALVLSVGLVGADALGVSLAGLARLDVWKAGFQTSFTMTVFVALVASLAAFFAAKASGIVLRRSLSSLAVAGIGVAFASSGHASVATPQFLMRPSVFIHVAAVALWAGALIPLLTALRKGADAKQALSRFSRFVLLAVVALAASGIALAVVQVARPSALWETSYGLVLLVKLAALSAIGVLAFLNRFVLTSKVLHGDGKARRWLARSIVAEIALVIAVLGIVSLWRFTPPPRALVTNPPVLSHLHNDELMASVTWAPQSGALRLELFRSDFSPLEAKEVTVRLLDREAGIEPITRTAKPDRSKGQWLIDNVRLTGTAAGSWTIEIEALVSDFDRLSISGPLTPSTQSDAGPDDSAFVHIHGVHAMADVTVTPGRTGIVRITIQLMGDDLAPLLTEKPGLTLVHPERDGPLVLPLRPAAPGEWKAGPTTLPLSGIWTAKIETTQAGSREVLDGPIVLEPATTNKKE